MNRWAIRVLLGISGLLLLAIGTGVLFTPHAFFATNGIELGSDPTHLSEVRAPGGLLFVSALIILLGVVRRDRTRDALRLAALTYFSYGGARLAGFAIDGLPSPSLIAAAFIELVLGCVNGAAVLRTHRAQQHANESVGARAVG